MNNYLKIIASMLIWSTWGLQIRWMELPAVVVLFYTSLIASFTVPAALKARGEFPPLSREDSWGLFGLLVLASLANNITYFYALANTTISNAVFTHYTAPLFVAVLAPFLIAEKLEKVTLISLPISMLGMVMIVASSGGISFNGEHTAGIIAGTASGAAYALLIMVSRTLSRRMQHHKAIVVLIWATAVVTAPFALSMDYHISSLATALLIAAGLLHSTLAPLMYFSALRKVIAQHAAILGYMEPLAAVPLAFLFLSETPSPITLIGGLLILFSGYMVVHYGRGKTEAV